MEDLKSSSLKGKYSLYIFLGVILPSIIAIILASFFIKEEIRANLDSNIALIEKTTLKRVDEFLSSTELYFLTLSETIKLSPNEMQKSLLNNFLEHNSYFEAAGILSKSGKLLKFTTKQDDDLEYLIGFDFSNMDFFTNILEDKKISKNISTSIFSNEPTIVYVKRYEEFIVFANLNLQKLDEIVSDIGKESFYQAFLVDSSGNLIFSSEDREMVKERVNISNHPLLKSKDEINSIVYKEGDESLVGKVKRLEDRDLYMGIFAKKSDAFSLLSLFYYLIFLAIIIEAVYIYIFYRVSSKNIFMPLEVFAQKSELISQGRYDIDMPTFVYKEIKPLSESFHRMLESIKSREGELKELNANLQIKIEKAIEKEKEQQLIMQEQMKNEAMGELLLNLAHQWRQPLNVVAISIQNIGDLIEYDDGNPQKINEIISKSVDELSALSKTITDLTSHYKSADSEYINLKKAYELSKKLAGHIIVGANIEYVYKSCQDCEFKVQKGAIVDILFSMMLNVRDISIARKIKEPKIELSCGCEAREDHFLIYIRDNCGGIDEELLPTKLFEPYTTTSFKSREKGLGLYNVKNSIKHTLKGNIKARNSEFGAEFIITLPKGNN